MPARHTDSFYENELERLRDRVLLMGAKAEEIARRALASLAERDRVLATRVIALDGEVDRLEVEIDELALALLARRQPVASDLRFVASVLKMVTDLERVGDLGVNIGERAAELAELPPLPEQAAVLELGESVMLMLHEALDAFVQADEARARGVLDKDEAVDATFSRIFEDLVRTMIARPDTVERATRLQSLARYLERIADHATNVAERVVFMVRGKDVRHSGRG
jgi:phosphate transport system protein